MTTRRDQKSEKTTRNRGTRGHLDEITKGIERGHAHRGLERETERWAEESEAYAASVVEAETRETSRQEQRALRRVGSKLKTRQLRLLERDDDLIREVLRRKGKLSAIMAADQPTDADEMLWFIDKELKILPAFEELALPSTYTDEKTGKEVKRRTNYTALLLGLLSLLSRYLGLANGPETQAVLLCDLRWMSLFGFNALEVQNGACRRSESLKGKTREEGGGRFVEADEMGPVRARLGGPRGALSSQTIEELESTVEPEKLMALFNTSVRALARRGFLPKKIRASLDSTSEEVVPSFSDAGVVRKKVKVQSKARRPRQVEILVRGFKVWFLMDSETGFPLSMAFDNIETPEIVPARELVDQARDNLGRYGRIVSLAIDRGFLDGDLLWWLKKERRIDWVCPSKEKMHVTAEARTRSSEALAALQQRDEAPLETARWAARRGLSHEGVSFFERVVGPGRDTLVVAQVNELTDTDFYGPGGSSSSRANSKSFRPTPLHATVVLNWPDRAPADREDQEEHDESSRGPVVLLSPIEEAGILRFDRYDERSLIENRVNRDAKQYFGLGKSLARNRSAMWSANVFSTLALMFHRALDLHRQRMLEDFDQRCEVLGVLRYRRQLALRNRGRIIIVVKNHYGFLLLSEFAKLAGFEFF